jgi:hypothetical protein
MCFLCGVAPALRSHGCYAPGATLPPEEHAGAASGEYVAFGNKWGLAAPAGYGSGATVTYSFADSHDCSTDGVIGVDTCVALSSFMPSGWQAEIEAALAAWSSVADITFNEVPDSGDPHNAATSSGEIRFAGHTFDGPGGTLAHAFFPPVNNRC